MWLVLLLPCYIEIAVFNSNSLDTDYNAASDQGLNCLPMSLYGTQSINW